MISKSAIIHSTAIIDSGAHIGDNVQIGPFTIVEDCVEVGAGSIIAANVLLAKGAKIGSVCRISIGAIIATTPQDLKFGGEESEVVVGNRTVIREYATINRGTAHAHRVTRIGDDCLLMAYSHVAHDCQIGDKVIIANCVQLGGHVEIGDWVNIGGMTAVHQFCKIGAHSFVGGMSRVAQDVPPYILTTGDQMKYLGPNKIGLKRRGFSDLQIDTIKKVYKLIYRSKYNLGTAVNMIKSEIEITPEVSNILEFISQSKRGLVGLNVPTDDTIG